MTAATDTITVELAVERRQSKTDSAIETVVNVAIGYLISLAVWAWIIGPLFGIHTNGATDTAIVSLFTFTSLARQFALRRIFNGKPVWATIKALFA